MNTHDAQDDIIHIEDLQVECIIGIFDWERELPQRVTVNLQVPCDCSKAKTDSIEETVDYKALCKFVIDYIQNSKYQLIETLIETLAQACLQEMSLSWIRLRIDKPGALRGARTVGIEIFRKAT